MKTTHSELPHHSLLDRIDDRAGVALPGALMVLMPHKVPHTATFQWPYQLSVLVICGALHCYLKESYDGTELNFEQIGSTSFRTTGKYILDVCGGKDRDRNTRAHINVTGELRTFLFTRSSFDYSWYSTRKRNRLRFSLFYPMAIS
jgi:hypothetical protein